MNRGTLVVQRFKGGPPDTFLPSAEATEILNRLWAVFLKEFEHNPPTWNQSASIKCRKTGYGISRAV
jgi:hypothetical protein